MDETTKLTLFEQTIVPHLSAAYNLARWFTRDPHEAEDMVQEAYLRAFRFFDSFRGGDGRAWLLSVVRNTCLTSLRRKASTTGGEAFDEQAHVPLTGQENAEERLMKESEIRSLQNCVESLPAEYREVIVMRELEELSYREIAKIAGIPIGTVMSRLSRGRLRLLDCMGAK